MGAVTVPPAKPRPILPRHILPLGDLKRNVVADDTVADVI